MRSLLTSLNTVAADEMQTILTVAEHLRSNLENEVERVKQAQKQYDELLARYDDVVKLWATDKEKIRKQRDEIGMEKDRIFVIILWFGTFFVMHFIQSSVRDSSVSFSDQAWRERDAALLRDQMAQSQMYSMREKLDAIESAVKNVNKSTREE